MPLSSNSRKKPLTLGESYNIVSSGIGTYLAEDVGDKQLWVWGYNAHGELPVCNRIFRSSAIQISGTNWKDVCVGNHHMVAVKEDGTLWTWGYNNHGQLGQCGANPNSSPNQLPGTNWCGVTVGDTQSMALKTDGTLWVWGHNDWGQLGLSTCPKCAYRSPTQVPGTNWRCVLVSRHHGLGVKCDGTLWSWGHNGSGQLGYCCIVCPYPGTCCSPVVINPATNQPFPCCSLNTCINPCFSSPTQIPGTNWNQIAINNNTSFATKTDNTLWGWGENIRGQLANNGTTGSFCPLQIPGTNWVEITAKACSFLGRKSDNTLWGWGSDAEHSSCGLGLGIPGIIGPRSSPIQIPGCWVKIDGTGYMSLSNRAKKVDGTLWTWGVNWYGEVGSQPFTCTNGNVRYNFNCHGWGGGPTTSFSSPTLICGTGWLCGSSSRHSTAWIKCV
jgi:alpha-tubulin suppressor-like RCC1 family protein